MSTQDGGVKNKRLAPPSLFVPPSRNISTTDLNLSQQTTRSSISNRNPLLRQRSTQAEPLLSSSSEPSTAASPRQAPVTSEKQDKARSRRISTTERTWVELQNTLEEVELSAASVTNVFGPDHSRALEELRKAQVELARAWARGEEGEEEGDDSAAGDGLSGHKEGEQSGLRGASAVLASDRSQTIDSGAGQGAGKDAGQTKSGSKKTQLEEETENDILLARKRRLANDKYFDRVNKGVADVVAKLEIVADKMGGVEMESQDIWGDKDSLDNGSVG